MSTALEATYRVLREAAEPLHYQEIARRAIQQEYWQTSGKTPAATINAQLAVDIRKHGPASQFRRVGRGVFGLTNGPTLTPETTTPSAHPVQNHKTLSFTDSAEQVLTRIGNKQPMHYRDITTKALELGLVSTTGRTPEATMYAQIIQENQRRTRRGERTRFERYGKGMVGLTKWHSEDPVVPIAPTRNTRDMVLRNSEHKPEYRSGESNIIQEFYHPALKCSSAYWRAVGFFSSSAFEAIGEPMGEFFERGGTVRLVTSVRLEPDDVEAIKRGLSRLEACEDRILRIIHQDFANATGRGAALLARLLQIGRLEIRIAIPADGIGIYHEKVGVFADESGDYLAFSGSSNETRSGLEVNYECVDVYSSWEEPERAEAKKRHFELLWENRIPGAETFDFPEAAKRELIHICKSSPNPPATELVPSPENRWRHQDEAVAIFLSRERGVLEMATGTGKTRTALRISEELINRRGLSTIIVAADGTDLLNQWYKQLLELTRHVGERFAILRHYHDFHERERFVLSPLRRILLISRPALAPALRSLPADVCAATLLIHDEVHRLGSVGSREALQGLSDKVRYRLGLSATPEREYDAEGNQFIENHIGPVVFQFGLSDAIRRGILSPFNYYPLEYELDDDDRQRIRQVYARAAARQHTGQPMCQEEIWIEIAKVYKTSLAKIPVFESFISRNRDLLRRCIIFVETREYGDRVLDIVHRYRHDFHTYFAAEDSETLVRFARGELECLLTCHRLSEGIDIKSLSSVILFSSARARLETIQRMGRCLRSDPDNLAKRAHVVDFVRAGDPAAEEATADDARRRWLTELSKVNYEESVV